MQFSAVRTVEIGVARNGLTRHKFDLPKMCHAILGRATSLSIGAAHAFGGHGLQRRGDKKLTFNLQNQNLNANDLTLKSATRTFSRSIK